MADDLIMNFDFDNVEAAAPQVTFKGGRWRDRKRAQREYKKKQNPGAGNDHDDDDNDNSTASPAKANKLSTQKRPRADGGDSERPFKRSHGGGDEAAQQRWPSGGGGGDRAPAGRPQNGVTSRLFTSIPTHTTDFEEADAAAATAGGDEPVHASNAPLSEEAHSFLKLGLSRRIARQLSDYMGLKAPTAIQKNAILQLLSSDDDAFLQAETGSGKTLAYLLPIVQRLLALSEDNDGKRRPVQVSRDGLGLLAVVLAPTRELCVQISTVLDKLLGCARFLQSTTVLGGEKKKAEKARLRKGTNILVATPGRLTDHLDNTEVLDLSRVRWLVLDEGDRLMEMGFEKDIRAIVSKIRAGRNANDMVTTTKDGQPIPNGILPARRVTVLCSATMKMNAIKLGELTLEEAVHIRSTDSRTATATTATTATIATTTTTTNEAGETVTTTTTDDPAKAADTGAMFDAPSQLKQTYAIVPGKLRLVTLIGLLRSTFARKDKVMKAIIFLSCADSVDYHFDLLRQFGNDGKPVANPDLEETPPTSSDTIAPAAYITSAANRTIVLHKLHGSLHQPVRKATLASFRNENKRPTLLITTDIASRGLDVPEVDLVIEYDPAMAVEDHMHRIGRTARAGRSGNTTLFVQPGCEEGYITYLKSKQSAHSQSVLMPQLYDTILKKGYAAPVDLPEGFTMGHKGGIAEPELPTWTGANTAFPEIPAEHDPSQPMQSWTKRAEALQLHIEQRLLKSAAAAGVDPKDGRSSRNAKAKDKKKDARSSKNNKTAPAAAASSHNLLDSARQAFRSHIRAYATHTHEERVYFDMTQLHLGHMAKAFGLREAPGNMGGSIGRLTKPAPKQKTRNNNRDSKDGKERTGTRVAMPAPRRRDDDSDDDFAAASVDDAEARRRMQIKMREMMSNPASEFNIG